MPAMQYDNESKSMLMHIHCTLTFEDMEKPQNLPLEVLQSYLRQDVTKLCRKQNIKSFKDSLLFIEKVDYLYNAKKVITHKKKH